jgi:hypothetical protein
MIADPARAVVAVGACLGGAAARVAAERELVTRVVAASSFDSMKRDQRRWSSARPADMPEFVRKGVVGDWTQQLSREQARRLAAKFVERARGTAAKTLWPEVLATART